MSKNIHLAQMHSFYSVLTYVYFATFIPLWIVASVIMPQCDRLYFPETLWGGDQEPVFKACLETLPACRAEALPPTYTLRACWYIFRAIVQGSVKGFSDIIINGWLSLFQWHKIIENLGIRQLIWYSIIIEWKKNKQGKLEFKTNNKE